MSLAISILQKRLIVASESTYFIQLYLALQLSLERIDDERIVISGVLSEKLINEN